MDMMTLAMAKSYTDSQRLAYEETTVKPMLDVTMNAGFANGVQIEMLHRLDVGAIYAVTVNGVTNDVECITSEGSPVLAGFGGDIVDWGIERGNATGNNNWSITIYDTDEHPDGTECRVTVEQRETIVHTIEPKFLPGVCLPVIEVASQSATLTGAEALQIDAAVQAKTPIILKVKTDNWGWLSVFMHYLDNYDEKGYFFHTFSGPVFSGYAVIQPEYNNDNGYTGNWLVSFSAGA